MLALEEFQANFGRKVSSCCENCSGDENIVSQHSIIQKFLEYLKYPLSLWCFIFKAIDHDNLVNIFHFSSGY